MKIMHSEFYNKIYSRTCQAYGPYHVCFSHLLSQCNTMTLDHIVTLTTLDLTAAAISLDVIFAFDTIFAHVILTLALLMSSPLMWHSEHLWDISVVQRAHISKLVLYGCETGYVPLRNGHKIQVFQNKVLSI
jgi:hypothetical protein